MNYVANFESLKSSAANKEKSLLNCALITGASGGLGQALTKELLNVYLEQEKSVFDCLILVSRHAVADLAALLPKFTVPVCLLDLDLTQAEAANELSCFLDSLFQENWRIKWLINNAAYGKKAAFLQQEAAELSMTLQLNCKAATLLTHNLLKREQQLVDSLPTYILNIASSAAWVPQADFACYSASKAYLYNWSLALAEEMQRAAYPVSVCVACPGPMPTKFLQTANSQLSWYKKLALEQPQRVAAKALKACFKGKRVIYSHPCAYLLRLLSKLLPLTWLSKA